jgi:hypothetical protein
MKYWEIIADSLSKAGWSLGCVSAIDSNGRTIWIVDAHRDNGKNPSLFYLSLRRVRSNSENSIIVAPFTTHFAANMI